METYIGQRYVPQIEGVWNQLKAYENLSIVTFNNSSYTSKKIVPEGVDILNENYWIKTGDYIAQVDEFKEEVTTQLTQTNNQLTQINGAPIPTYKKNYDKLRTVYNPIKFNFDSFRGALSKARVGNGLVNIGCIGTSITAGHGAVAGKSDYPTFLMELFKNSGIPIAGTGLVPCHHSDSPKDYRWNFTGNWSVFGTGLFLRTPVYKSSGWGDTALFTSNLPGTVAEVWYSDTSDPFTISVDGLEPVTITPTKNGGNVLKWAVTGLSDTTHTINITANPTSGLIGARIIGAGVRRETGLLVHNLGMGGSEISDVYQGNTLFSPLSIVNTHLSCDIIILDGQTNEARNSTGVSTYENRISDVISTVSSSPSGSKKILFIANIPANNLNLIPYREVLYKKVDENNLTLLDLYDRWQQWGVSNALGYMNDSYHPTPSGNFDYAKAVFNTLTMV